MSVARSRSEDPECGQGVSGRASPRRGTSPSLRGDAQAADGETRVAGEMLPDDYDASVLRDACPSWRRPPSEDIVECAAAETLVRSVCVVPPRPSLEALRRLARRKPEEQRAGGPLRREGSPEAFHRGDAPRRGDGAEAMPDSVLVDTPREEVLRLGDPRNLDFLRNVMCRP